MDINQLPVELLMQIFSYLPTYKKVALVNRRFYSIVCNMNSSLRITDPFFERFVRDNVLNPNCLQSILTSERKITKVELGGYFARQAQRQFISSFASVVERFSESIKSLTYADIIVDESTFLHILTLAPYVEHLKLQNLKIHTDRQPLKKRRLCDNNKDLNLKNLKSLSISGCGQEFVGIFNRLPAGVLSYLRISDAHWHSVNDVLSRQLKIKNLKLKHISGDVGAMDIFNMLNLEMLELHGDKMNGDTIVAILSTQIDLKSITVTAGIVDGLMNALRRHQGLESLSLDITDLPVEFFAVLRKLWRLKDLTLGLNDDGMVLLEELVKCDLYSIRRLRLYGFFCMWEELCPVLAKSAPQLRHLRVCPTPYFSTSSELDAIMSHFNFLEVLEVNVMEKPLSGETDHIFNANLKELTIEGETVDDGPLCTPWLTKLMASYPNLRKLKVIVQDHTEQANSLQFEPILRGFTKLESLSVDILSVTNRMNHLFIKSF